MKKKKKPAPNYRQFETRAGVYNEMSDKERQQKEELEEYRKNRKKVWYL